MGTTFTAAGTIEIAGSAAERSRPEQQSVPVDTAFPAGKVLEDRENARLFTAIDLSPLTIFRSQQIRPGV